MELSVRVSLFHVMDLFLNNYFIAVPKNDFRNNTKFRLNDLCALVDQEDLTQLLLSLMSVWFFLRLFTLVLILGSMLELAIPAEKKCRLGPPTVWTITSGLIIIGIQSLNYCLNLSFYIEITMQILSRCIAFSSICTFIVPYNIESIKSKMAMGAFILLLITNVPTIEYQLAKYALTTYIFYRIFPVDLQLPNKCRPMVCFCLIHASPLLLQSLSQWPNQADSILDWSLVISNGGFIIARVFLVLSLLSLLTTCFFSALKYSSLIFRFPFKTRDCAIYMTSPAFFFLFQMDNEFWKADGSDDRWRSIQTLLMLHLIAHLTYLSNLVRRVEEARIALGLSLFILIGAIFVLRSSSFYEAPRQFIVSAYALYVILHVLVNVAELAFTEVDCVKRVVDVTKCAEFFYFAFGIVLLLSAVASMSHAFVFGGWGLSILMGAIYHARVLVRLVACNAGKKKSSKEVGPKSTLIGLVNFLFIRDAIIREPLMNVKLWKSNLSQGNTMKTTTITKLSQKIAKLKKGITKLAPTITKLKKGITKLKERSLKSRNDH